MSVANSEGLARGGAFSLRGMRILITGAAGGIGSAAARICADGEASLVLTDIADEARIRAAVGPSRADADVRRLDVADRAAVDAAARDIGPIDALIDASGVYPHADWLDPDFDAALDLVLRVNVGGPINLARAFFPGMAERGAGRIVLCGSIAGWMGGVKSGPHYAFSKGGLHAFVRWLSRRGAPHNVLVNAVAPSTTNTQMMQGIGYDPSTYPLRRVAEPAEIAAAMAFLCSPGASYISGAIIDVNGGLHLR
ncbi:MAG: SDR family oxidoreductase [Alphaproteobacteria bacterium]